MKASNLSCLLGGAVLAALALLPTAEAQPSPDGLYTITLTTIAAVDEPHVVAAQIATAVGGTVETVTEETVTMRLSRSRARVVAADPRVQSIAPAKDAGSTRSVAAEAERMTWSTGVAYDYDGSGNVRQIGTDTFVYDTVGRLVQSHTNGTPRNYEYDAFGNRTRCRESEGTANEGDCQNGYTINPANNRLENTTYDSAGNVTGMGAHTYSYDALNMQTRAAWGSLVREYIYTADDERIAIYEVGQRWRWTVRDTSGKVLREFTSTGSLGTTGWQWTKDYVWRDGLLLASRQMEGSAVTTYHYHLDHLGTPRRITDATDRIVGIHDYFPFGTEQSGAQNEPSLSLMKFTGHERDIVGPESWDTLDYMHARYESTSMGRFLSVDPTWESADLGKPQSWNRYSYVMNNPVNVTDPDGRCPTCIFSPISFRVGLGPLNPDGQQRAKTAFKVQLAVLGVYLAPSVGRALFTWALGNPNQVKQVTDAVLSPPGSSALPAVGPGRGERPVGSLAGKCAECAKADLAAIQGSTIVSGAFGKGTHYAVETTEGMIVDRSIRDNLQTMGAKYDDIPIDKTSFSRKEWEQLLERVRDTQRDSKR